MSNQQQPRVIVNPQSLQRPPHPPRRGPQGPQAVRDIRQTKEYKIAARRWLSTIVALPIALYTSYVLYERTYLNKSQKHLGRPSGSGPGEGGKDGSA